MKKVLYGVALTLLASVSVGSLQSCKDDVNDLATQTSYDLSKLRQQLNEESASLLGKISAEEAARKAAIDHVTDLINDLDAKHDRDIARIDGALSELERTFGDKYAALDAKVDALYPNEYFDEKFETIQGELDALKAFAEAMPGQLEEIYQAIEQTQEFLTQALNAHAADIEDLQGQIDVLVDAVDSIIAKLDKQVTGIIIQGVNSPVFGDFRTPLGVKSNILFNWYGYNERNAAIEFPSNMEGISATGAPALPNLTPAKTYTAPIGYYGDADTDVTLGKVYVTLNPVGAQFDNLELSIENSAGVALPYTVTLTPSDYVLKHGISRAEANDVNGFYEGEVKMPLNEKNVNDIVVALEEDLKVALKDVVKDPSKTTAKALVNAFFQQLQGKIPAYGLRYGWTTGLDDETDPGFAVGSYSAVLSQYALAVATSLPLGYNFAAGYPGSSVKLPEIGHIQNFINKLKEIGQFTFTFKPFTVDGIQINLGEVKFENINTDIRFKLDNVTLTYEGGKDPEKVSSDWIVIDGNTSGMNDMLDDIKEAINTTLKSANTQVNTDFETFTKNIEKQVNDMMASINDQVSGKINDVISSLENKLEPYYGKINSAIDLYNKIASKINNFIKDPNAYMQVAAFYNLGGANYGIVSGKASDPTPFVGNGQAFKLYLSSYTAELIVPACKKYVAISAVKGDDTRSLADINSAAGEEFNTVLDGNKIVVSVPAAALKSGNVYEFTYQALDYRGYTSTKKFYIEVK